ncbi:hypothetical protein LR48_Vigan115s001100 [Vigna angularis]|uniref:Uncharacterized protein n=1 Tax=Phaseolus angularis TaxID=3914 RepID=A0A0L9T5D5_PHAAN|nr:hypothetical protein LR48_Vigan115s001100 [Vigna angularis]
MSDSHHKSNQATFRRVGSQLGHIIQKRDDLGSNMKANPKEECQAIITRRDKVLDERKIETKEERLSEKEKDVKEEEEKERKIEVERKEKGKNVEEERKETEETSTDGCEVIRHLLIDADEDEKDWKLEEKILKQKADAIPPSQGGSPPQPPSPPSRHEKWKLARMRPSGTYSSDTAREISERIDVLVEQSSQGQFTPEGRQKNCRAICHGFNHNRGI